MAQLRDKQNQHEGILEALRDDLRHRIFKEKTDIELDEKIKVDSIAREEDEKRRWDELERQRKIDAEYEIERIR